MYNKVAGGRPSTAPLVVFLAIEAIIFFWLYRLLYSHPVLIYDDPAFLTASQGHFIRWFTHGFSDYFVMFPQWTTPFTNFLRPVSNFSAYCLQALFGSNYALYYTFYYGAAFLWVYFSLLVLKKAGVDGWRSILMAVLLGIGPAFLGRGLLLIAFYFDIVAALFCMIALVFLLDKKYIAASVWLTIAVFTKETALYAPVAAALSVILFHRPRSLKVAAILLMPAILLALARYNAFGTVLGGTYSHIGLSAISDGLRIWPLGVSDLRNLFSATASGHISFDVLLRLLFVAANIVLWARLAFIVVPNARALWKGKDPNGEVGSADFVYNHILLWLAGSLAYVVLNGVSGRFGGSVEPFLIMTVLIASQRSTRGQALGVATIALICGAYAVNSVKFVHNNVPRVLDIARVQERFYGALRSLPQTGEDVLIVNSFGLYSSPEYLEKILGLNLKITLVNQVAGCLGDTANSAKLAHGGVVTWQESLDVTLPSCARFVFTGTNIWDIADRSGFQMARAGVGDYYFPQSKLIRWSLRGKAVYGLGNKIIFHPDPKFDVALVYRFDTENFEVMKRPK